MKFLKNKILSNFLFIQKNSKFQRFLLFGGISSLFASISFPVIHYWILPNNFNNSYIVASITNVTFSFAVQKYFVFCSDRSIIQEYIKFITSSLIVILIGYIIFYILYRTIKIDIYVSNLIVIVISALASYIINNIYSFKKNND
jgi:putative flippase GtrA